MRLFRLLAYFVFGCAAYRVALDVDQVDTLADHGGSEEASAWTVYISEFAKKNELVAAGLEKLKQLTELGEQLKAFAAAVKNAYDASRGAIGAAVDFGSKLKSTKADIEEHQLGPAFDGQITPQDLQALVGKVDIFLVIVERFLSTTTDLQTVAGLLETLVSMITKVLAFVEATADFAGIADAASLDAMRSFEARATALGRLCDSELVKLTSVKSDLEPVLKEWNSANRWTRGVILVKNKVQLQRGFDNLGAVWSSVQELQPSLQALSGEVSEEILSLRTSAEKFKLPSRSETTTVAEMSTTSTTTTTTEVGFARRHWSRLRSWVR